jgi:hypothetical protein
MRLSMDNLDYSDQEVLQRTYLAQQIVHRKLTR